jgi:hypothetical protein
MGYEIDYHSLTGQTGLANLDKTRPVIQTIALIMVQVNANWSNLGGIFRQSGMAR